MRILQFYFALLTLTALMSCKSTTPGSSDVMGVGSENRAEEIHREVKKTLESKYSDSKGKLWSDSRGAVGTDWILASPEGYWGKRENEFPKDFECTPGKDGCDDVFARKVCSSDQDCAGTNTNCRVLEASASSNRKARRMCLSSADNLLDRFYKTMVSTEDHLEVVSLSMPSGVFRAAFINALTILHQKATPPSVRILLAGEEVLQVNQLQPAQKALEKIWNEMRKAGDLDGDSRMQMNMGYVSKQFSWNHAKLIIADKKIMIQGGHNMWGDPYLISRPVSDLSMEVTGPVVAASQAFVDTLWSENNKLKKNILLLGSYFGSLPKMNSAISPPSLPGSKEGSVPMIAVGRLGNLGKNPSDDASRAMIRSAKKNIDFIVQDLYGLISNLKIIDSKPWAFDEIANALMRGVRMRVIQSDTDVGPNDYTLIKYQSAFNHLINNVADYAGKKGFKAPTGQSNRAFFCGLVEWTPIRYVAGKNRWDDKKGYGSHAKLLIVDDSAFYMGSHNYYEANLQEFGLIVTDHSLTKKLQVEYWEPIWKVSKSYAAKCG